MSEKVQAVVVGIGETCAVVQVANVKALIPRAYAPLFGVRYGDVVKGELIPAPKPWNGITHALRGARIVGHAADPKLWLEPSQPTVNAANDDEAWEQALQG